MLDYLFAIPEGPALELFLQPRLESWERRDHPAQVALGEFVAHVLDRVDPLLRATPGRLAFRLDVGLPENVDPLWERDLDNYLFPIARSLPERVVSVWATKGRGRQSFVRVAPAISVEAPLGWQEYEVPPTSANEGRWKSAVRRVVEGAAELPEGPVALQLALTVARRRDWPRMWKGSIDGLEPLLGRTDPSREWNPLDGRIVRLGLHRRVDPSVKHRAAMLIWARSADERSPELEWLARMDVHEREAYFADHRRRAARRTTRVHDRAVRRASAPETRPANLDDMTVQRFVDDDHGYLAWVAAHQHGYVINVQRALNPSDARLHHAYCRTVSGENPRRGAWTDQYIKFCSPELAELDAWATQHFGAPIKRCGICRPPRSASGDDREPNKPTAPGRRAAPRDVESAPPRAVNAPAGRWDEAARAQAIAELAQTHDRLERDLRTVVRGRLQALEGNWRDRLLKALQERRRAELAELPGHQLMEQLYFIELRNIVSKYWPEFEERFRDKQRFQQAMTTANARLHAHAKDFDLADLALQRREYKWLQERVDA